MHSLLTKIIKHTRESTAYLIMSAELFETEGLSEYYFKNTMHTSNTYRFIVAYFFIDSV